MEIKITGEAKEIAALVMELQEQQAKKQTECYVPLNLISNGIQKISD